MSDCIVTEARERVKETREKVEGLGLDPLNTGRMLVNEAMRLWIGEYGTLAAARLFTDVTQEVLVSGPAYEMSLKCPSGKPS